MAVDRAVRRWRIGLEALLEALTALRLSVVEDRPEAHVLADLLGNALDDLIGLAEEALALPEPFGDNPSDPTPDLAKLTGFGLRREAQSLRLAGRFGTEVAPIGRIAELTELASERQGDWPGWVAGVLGDLERVQRLLLGEAEARARYWQEVLERLSFAPSVQATNIGQQISLTDRPPVRP